jgi:hypothetical protein
MPIILATQETEIGESKFKAIPGQIVCKTLSQKYPPQKRASRVALVIKRLPSKCEALSSNLSTSKEERQERRKEGNRLRHNSSKLKTTMITPSPKGR